MTDNPFCYRCNDSLDGCHWIRLTTEHRGAVADNYRDVERFVCPDCLAAIGLLEIERSADPARTTEAPTDVPGQPGVRSKPETPTRRTPSERSPGTRR
ncbi:hypothetical protein [Halovivax gelatinilyticus]|uniref:hypothetical protein n=1 Tax=Halovivax gelatinilyticus TaxID=2961597 RepID=UPI0020CA7CE1|nr:hypothetical protein [Halovivax gelatinilyticus]